MNKKYPTFFLTWFNKFTRVPYPGEVAVTKLILCKQYEEEEIRALSILHVFIRQLTEHQRRVYDMI